MKHTINITSSFTGEDLAAAQSLQQAAYEIVMQRQKDMDLGSKTDDAMTKKAKLDLFNAAAAKYNSLSKETEKIFAALSTKNEGPVAIMATAKEVKNEIMPLSDFQAQTQSARDVYDQKVQDVIDAIKSLNFTGINEKIDAAKNAKAYIPVMEQAQLRYYPETPLTKWTPLFDKIKMSLGGAIVAILLLKSFNK